MPLPSTAIVNPEASRQPLWASASIPRARPLTTATPCEARPAESDLATLSP